LILWLSSFTISTPVFVTCVLLSFVFSYILGLLPPSGKDGYNLSYLILPALALASRSLALIVRVVRNELLGVMSSQYIIMATSLGFHPVKILCIFALKNILVPVLTVVLLDFGAYLGGAVVTESVYAWPGVGRLLITAMLKRDFPVIQGVILLGTLLFILIGVCIDFIQDTVVKREA
jgi:peptide/nickel transport system permease protein